MSDGSGRGTAAKKFSSGDPEWSADVISVALLGFIPVLLFADILFLGNTFFFRDLTAFYFPTKKVLRDVWLSGAVPYWNDSYAGGQPFAANPGYQVFYPLQALILLPSYQLGYHLSILIHIPIGLIGMYALLRSIGLRVTAALFGALSFGLSGFLLSYVNIVNFLSTVAWLPWVLFSLRRFLLTRGARRFAAAAAVLGIELLAAEPTIIVQTGVLMAGYACHLGWRDGGLKGILHRLVQTAAVIAVALSIAAIQVLPTLDLIPDTPRFDHPPSLEDVATWSMPPLRILEILYPQLLGTRVESGSLRWEHEIYGGKDAYLLSLYLGLFMALMAVTGTLSRYPGRSALLAVAALGFVLALGTHTPLLKFLYEAGAFRSIRYPEKFILLAMFPLTVLGSLTFHRLIAGDRSVRIAAFFVAVAVAACAALGAAFTWTPIFAPWFVDFWQIRPKAPLEAFVSIARREALMVFVRASLGLALLIVPLRRATLPRSWAGGVLLLVLWDLGQHSNEVVERVSAVILEPPPVVGQLPAGGGRYRLLHESRIDNDHGSVAVPRAGNATYWFIRNALLGRTPGAWGFQTALDGDYDLTNLPETRALTEAVMRLRDRGIRETPEVFRSFSNVGAVVRFRKGSLFDYLRPEESQIPVVVEPAPGNPRYYFSDQMVLLRDFDDFVDKTARREWSKRVAFVYFDPFKPAAGFVHAVSEQPNQVKLDVTATARAYLVISITPHRYWKASIDGRPSPLIRTNVGYQGLIVPPGRHRIELRYRNPWVVAGAAISLITILALSVAAALERRAANLR